MTITLSQSDYWGLFEQFIPKSPEADDAGGVFSIPAAFGCVFWQEYPLREGVDLAIEEAYFCDDLVVQQGDRPHPIEFTVEQGQPSGATQPKYCLYGSGLAPKDTYRIPGRVRTRSINVHIAPAVFQHWIGGMDNLPEVLQGLLRSPHEHYYEQSGTLTPAMQMTVQQILNCPFHGLTQRLYLESKVWELMALLLADLESAPVGSATASPLKPDDVERIHDASKILQTRLLNPPSLVELARAVGINDHKLKVGFRQVFDTTVFGYLHDRRMERSRQLLESGDLSVAAAAEAVGFASRGHFAAAFRRKYGVNPGVYARQQHA